MVFVQDKDTPVIEYDFIRQRDTLAKTLQKDQKEICAVFFVTHAELIIRYSHNNTTGIPGSCKKRKCGIGFLFLIDAKSFLQFCKRPRLCRPAACRPAVCRSVTAAHTFAFINYHQLCLPHPTEVKWLW